MPASRIKSGSAAFTLVELLTVIAIIIILAGLILSTSGYVQRKGATARASAEIAALSAACENYKADNGIYPRNTDTDTLNAKASGNSSAYALATLYLYEELSGDKNADRAVDANMKSYFEFKPNMLTPKSGTINAIIDPFGNSYGYSTALARFQEPTPPTYTPSPPGYNPTFDLWSTNLGTTTADQVKWIKNW